MLLNVYVAKLTLFFNVDNHNILKMKKIGMHYV